MPNIHPTKRNNICVLLRAYALDNRNSEAGSQRNGIL